MTQKTQDTQAEQPLEDEKPSVASQTGDAHAAEISEQEEGHEETETESGAEEIDELKDQLLRVLAENENLRKRSERDLAAAKKYGALGLARDLLASIDNLETAILHMPEDRENMDEGLKNILIGVEMSARELANVLDKHGIKKLTPEQEKFDYNLHQAMFEIPTDEVEAGTVVQVVQPGYMLYDRLLRPAMVGVSKPASTASQTPEDTNQDTQEG